MSVTLQKDSRWDSDSEATLSCSINCPQKLSPGNMNTALKATGSTSKLEKIHPVYLSKNLSDEKSFFGRGEHIWARGSSRPP